MSGWWGWHIERGWPSLTAATCLSFKGFSSAAASDGAAIVTSNAATAKELRWSDIEPRLVPLFPWQLAQMTVGGAPSTHHI